MAPLLSLCLLAAAIGTPVVVHVEDLIGEWQDSSGTTYILRADHSMDRHYPDNDWGPRAHWELRGPGTIEISDPQKKSDKALVRITGFGRNILHLRWPDGGKAVWIKTSNRPNQTLQPTAGRRVASL